MRRNYKIQWVLILGMLIAFGGCSSGDDDNSDPSGGGVVIPPDPPNPPKDDDKDKEGDKKEYDEYDFTKSRLGDPHLYEFEVTGGDMDGKTFSGEVRNVFGESYCKNKDLESSNMYVNITIIDENISFRADAFLNSLRKNEDFGEEIPDHGPSFLTIKMDDGETANFSNPSGIYSIRNISYQVDVEDGFGLASFEYRFDADFEDEAQEGQVVHLYGRIICQPPTY